MQHKPNACGTYQDLSEDLLFRGIVDGFDATHGITDDEIEKEIFQVLPQLRARKRPADDLEDSAAQHDSDMRLLPRLSPDEVLQPPLRRRRRSGRCGSVEGRTLDFDRAHARSMFSVTAFPTEVIRKKYWKSNALKMFSIQTPASQICQSTIDNIIPAVADPITTFPRPGSLFAQFPTPSS
jgi:hypothetical protein